MAKSVYQTQEERRWARGDATGESAPVGTPAPPGPAAPTFGIDSSRHGVYEMPVEGASRAKVKRDHVIFFTTQLAVMVDTGVTLSEALDSIAEQTQDPTFKAVVTDLSEQVKGGVTFSAALAKYPRIFSRLLIALMRASEASGRMGTMLQRASTYLKAERETVKRIKGAMIYPICMLGFCTLVVTGLLIFVLPRFERIYAGKGAVLPAPTRALLAISHGLLSYWYLVLAVVVGSVVGLILFLRSPAGRDFMDSVRIRMPIIGGMYRKAYLARSLRTMATMVSTGVSLLETLDITAGVSGNHHFASIWQAVSRQAKEGGSLSEELAKQPLVPCTVTHMIAAGERTGQLADVMDRVAEFCEEDVKVAVKSVTTLIEPAMIIFMGVIIGGIAMALLLPVFRMSKLLH
jgi:type IV pilus assembly protein PilC